jgi:DNA-directed RNA polymerase specialized sigma24 family protein
MTRSHADASARVQTAGEAGGARTPAQAFDALYACCAPALVRQAYLLTGRHGRARAAVERAFQLAWQHWPEVARDRDPAGWVRAAAHQCALSPWHRFLPGSHRRPDPPPDPADRALQDTLLRLPPSYRRTLVLHDGVGLDLPETAAETEASTPAAAGRLMHAREAVAAHLPELADPAQLHRRLVRLASAGQLATAGATAPAALRTTGERSTRFWARSAIAFTATLIGTTVLTLHTAPTHHRTPVPPGHAVQGLPPPHGTLGPLPQGVVTLSGLLKAQAAGGPERLVPQAR